MIRHFFEALTINQKYEKQTKTSWFWILKQNFHKFIYVFLPSVLFLEHMELLVVQVLPPSQYHPTTYNSERKFPIVKVKSLKIKRVSIFSGNPRLRMRFPANFLCRHSIYQDSKLQGKFAGNHMRKLGFQEKIDTLFIFSDSNFPVGNFHSELQVVPVVYFAELVKTGLRSV